MGESNTAEGLIEQLHLAPHPEGGWYCETWRGPDRADGRAGGTAIIFLLKSGERSHWHTVDADEMWLWQAGDPLVLQIAESDEGPVEMITLGRDVGSGEALQGLVPTGAWQAAVPRAGIHGYSLVSCVVVPGFNFAGFTLAPPHWEPGKQP